MREIRQTSRFKKDYKLTDEVMVLTLVRTATLSDLFDE